MCSGSKMGRSSSICSSNGGGGDCVVDDSGGSGDGGGGGGGGGDGGVRSSETSPGCVMFFTLLGNCPGLQTQSGSPSSCPFVNPSPSESFLHNSRVHCHRQKVNMFI